MWQRLSLRGRINLLLALVLTLGLAVNVARLVLEAAPRVQAEDQSVTRLAREFVETIVTGLSEAPDPEARLDQIVRDLKRLRHVSITRQDEEQAVTPSPPTRGTMRTRCRHGSSRSFIPRRPRSACRSRSTARPSALVITSIPNDEIAEIWDGIVTQLEVGSAVAVALFLITMMVIGRALAPLEALSQAMTRIEAGSYDARVEPGGAPELAAICTRLNHLAMTLGECGRGEKAARRARGVAAGPRAQGDRARTA